MLKIFGQRVLHDDVPEGGPNAKWRHGSFQASYPATPLRRIARLWHRGAALAVIVPTLLLAPLGEGAQLGSSTAQAQTDPDELARRHFESGAAYFEQAEYESALREFRKAYELSRRPQILRNISVVEERLGHVSLAVDALDEYLAQSPKDPDVETVRIRRNNLKKRANKQSAERPPAAAPPPGPALQESPATQNKVSPKEAPPSPLDSPEQFPEEQPQPNRLPAYVALGIGGVAAAGALITGVWAETEHVELESQCAPNCTQRQVNTGETLALTSTVLSGAALLSLGIGAVLWVTADSDTKEHATSKHDATVDFQATRTGGYASATWSF